MVHKPIGADTGTGELPAVVETRIHGWIDDGDATNAAEITAEAALARNADNLTSGTVADARLPSRLSDVSLSATYVGRKGQVLTPEDFGAVGDGRTVTDAALNGTTTVTSATAAFTNADVGKRLVVLPAAGSSQATFAATILSRNSATSVTVDAAAGYSGTGLEMTAATDDTTALQTWLSDSSALTRLLPGKIYGFTSMLKLGTTYNVEASGTLKLMAQLPTPSWPAGNRMVPTAIWTDHAQVMFSKVFIGGVLDTSNLCQDGFGLKWVRHSKFIGTQVRGGAAGGRAFAVGDDNLFVTSYENTFDGCLTWRDFGVVPKSVQPMNGYSVGTGLVTSAAADTVTAPAHGLTNGQMVFVSSLTGSAGLTDHTNYYVVQATTNTFKLATRAGVTGTVKDITTDGTVDLTAYPFSASTGYYFAESATDNFVCGGAVSMGAQVGFETHGGNNTFGPGTHAWARPTIGTMDYAFDDFVGHCHYNNTYADTPVVGGYRVRSSTSPSFFTAATAFNGSFGGLDNVAFGFILDAPRAGHVFDSPRIDGQDSSHRFAAAVAQPDGTIVSPSFPWTNTYGNNVTGGVHDVTAPLAIDTQTSTSASLFTSSHSRMVLLDNTSPITYTISADKFVSGDWVKVVQANTGQVTFVPGAGVTLKSPQGFKTTGRYASVYIIRDPSTETFYLTGDLQSLGQPPQAVLSGQYFYLVSGASTGTSNTLGNNQLRVVPFFLPRTATLAKLGGDIATVGEAGSKLRLGIYADTGAMYPGTLLVDAGQINGDSATVQEITLGTPLTLGAGWYWAGAAVQSAPTTQPTVRTVNNSTIGALILPIGTTIPAANGTVVGYSNASVSGGLPSTFTSTLGSVAAAPRLFAKAS